MLNPDFRDVLSEFNAEGVEYLVVGAYAVAVHGLPRATGDLDLWINPAPENVAQVLRALERFGAPMENVKASDLQASDRVLQIGVPPSRVDILSAIDGVEFQDAWKNLERVVVDRIPIPCISLPDLVTNKRASGRPQDLADVERLTRRSLD